MEFLVLQQHFGALRHAWRQLGSRGWVSLAITLTLAIGIGGNTLVYSLVDALAFPPRPGIVDPGRVFEAEGRPDGFSGYPVETLQDLASAGWRS